MVMDLDRFKEVNDTLGHHSGDLLLQAAARRIRRAVRDSDRVARLGGDEFAVLLPDTSIETAAQVADRVQHALEERFTVSGASVDIEASIGIALYPEHAQDVATLLQRADLAMYKAKDSHAGQALYSPEPRRGPPEPALAARRAAAGDRARGADPPLPAQGRPQHRPGRPRSRRWCAGSAPSTAWCRRPSSSRWPSTPG